MVKVALLIGVSEYEPGLTPLPAATKDVEAMQRVLLHPEIGGFDEVTPLLNPQRHEMEEAIETFFENRQKDDLLLLFFSGHGIKDESGKLYFAARNTRKTDKGVTARATTVPANFVHEVMSNSRSKREVVILDCCFSGAFAEGLLARD
ncbi:MAG: caspase family protein [Nostoc sp.]|uniref:caspase family protein n=1 Tax=Nostoc sp. TaxID=1180 RepID=UPI002FF65D15